MKKLILTVLIICMVPAYGQGNDGQLKEVIFNTMWYPQAQFAGYFVAAEKGFYKKRGIKTKFIYSTFDSSVKDDILTGKADLGIMWLHEGIIGHDQDSRLVNIAQFIDSTNVLIVARSRDISNIGIWTPYVNYLETYVHKKISKNIEIVPVRDGKEAFIYGAIDAVTVMSYNEFNQLINSGIDTKKLYIYKLSDMMDLPLPEDGIYCLQDYYDKNKELCKNFIEASWEGWNYAFNNIDEAVKICLKYIESINYNSNVTIQKLMLNSIKEMTKPGKFEQNGYRLNKDSFDIMVKYLLTKRVISSEINYEDFCKGGW
jgi:NitT/TauT family transport system substrate-binding protein